eukprot:8065205-Karenia_brevis.AAC.1
MEACRAACLAAHSAASLLSSFRKIAGKDANTLGEAARLLRSGEALARAAMTNLQMLVAIKRGSISVAIDITGLGAAQALEVGVAP